MCVRKNHRHWIDADRDSCSTRAEVLPEETTQIPAVTNRYGITAATWYSYYDDIANPGA